MTSPRRGQGEDQATSISVPAGMTFKGELNPIERPREMEHRLRKEF
jgi:hypothetical protein